MLAKAPVRLPARLGDLGDIGDRLADAIPPELAPRLAPEHDPIDEARRLACEIERILEVATAGVTDDARASDEERRSARSLRFAQAFARSLRDELESIRRSSAA
jgi:hypothetical protein